MHSLIKALQENGNIELAVATSLAGYPPCSFKENGVTYFNICANRILETVDLCPRIRNRSLLRSASRLVNDWNPDLVHFHGSERVFGLIKARGMIDAPAVLSVQGIVEHCYGFALGELNAAALIKMLSLEDIVRFRHPLLTQQRYRRQIPIEQETLKGADAIIGRTQWDQAHARKINPEVCYFHVDEMIRPEFLDSPSWSHENAEPFSVFSTSGASPLKGATVLLEAISLLRRWGHPIRLRIAGVEPAPGKTGETRHIHRRICDLNVTDCVELLGWIPADALAENHQTSRCYVTPSYIENSSNALCEAQCVGVPCVASSSGGTPSIISDGHTGLLFQPGNPALLACQIERVLTDSNLASTLSQNARLVARQRHNPERIVACLLQSYNAIVSENSEIIAHLSSPPEHNSSLGPYSAT
ncbi:D-inositol 3-phosphate glycosyltransferase [Crateriforma conspicua]|uniref:D-inositol 3-phosphate glycosyltransferase n=2 Tax=Crateriforma conspicua TaxID=2527996 RepID=A0A5C5Y6F1_9PLAN|nr:D-inositol 3-phosphate glycosyltransferase [Crateriforma conspicua]